MDLGKFSYYARKIHRFLLLFVVVFGLVQMITGLVMKYPEIFSMVDQGSARLLHFQTATYFSVTFAVQMLTGLVMYVTPWLLRRLNQPKIPQSH